MAVAGLVAIALEVLLLLPRFLRLTKRLDELRLVYEDNLRLARDDLRTLSAAVAETQVLLRPYRRLQRWLGHPLTIALFASYRRRRAARRSRAPGT
jgi:hypothetical protein